jgi:hypothetical protein
VIQECGNLIKLVRVIAVIAVLSAFLAASPAAATESSTSSNPYICGSYCDGKSPYTKFWDYYYHYYYTCADEAHTIDSFSSHTVIVELRYSDKCESLGQISGSWVVTPGVSWGFVLGVLVGFLPAFAVVDFGVVGSSEQGEAG